MHSIWGKLGTEWIITDKKNSKMLFLFARQLTIKQALIAVGMFICFKTYLLTWIKSPINIPVNFILLEHSWYQSLTTYSSLLIYYSLYHHLYYNVLWLSYLVAAQFTREHVYLLRIDKGFCKAKMSCLLFAVLFWWFYNFSVELFTTFR